MSSPQPCKQKGDRSPAAAALYVHVPFCQAKCLYCDFYSVPVRWAEVDRYVRAVAAELRAGANCLARALDSIYVGGGTPTAIGPEPLRRLLTTLRTRGDGGMEFTVEANPGTLDAATVAVLAEVGVNRVSLGVQSFHPEELAFLGRRHTPEEARQAAATLRSAGRGNLSVDLIYGIPGQSLQSWCDSLNQAIDLGAEHLSAYALSFEPGTPLMQRLQAGQVRPADEQLQKDCYDAAIERMGAAGLEHYEISNFARPQRRCRHNLTYWRNEPYLGLGPAAASYVGGTRRTNRPDLPAYLEAVEAGLPAPAASEQLTGRAAMAETVMLGLRLIEGLDRAAFTARHGQDVALAFPRTIARYGGQGALTVSDRHVRLDARAVFASDTILADFLAEAKS